MAPVGPINFSNACRLTLADSPSKPTPRRPLLRSARFIAISGNHSVLSLLANVICNSPRQSSYFPPRPFCRLCSSWRLLSGPASRLRPLWLLASSPKYFRRIGYHAVSTQTLGPFSSQKQCVPNITKTTLHWHSSQIDLRSSAAIIAAGTLGATCSNQ